MYKKNSVASRTSASLRQYYIVCGKYSLEQRTVKTINKKHAALPCMCCHERRLTFVQSSVEMTSRVRQLPEFFDFLQRSSYG